jgi:hypothetical protein
MSVSFIPASACKHHEFEALLDSAENEHSEII